MIQTLHHLPQKSFTQCDFGDFNTIAVILFITNRSLSHSVRNMGHVMMSKLTTRTNLCQEC